MGKTIVRRMCIDGMLIAIFIILAKLTIKAGPIHIAFSALAVLFATCYFGLSDGLIVALLGETVIQLTSSYGITPTTPLWILPPAFRALVLGLCDLPFRKRKGHLDQHLVFYILANVFAALSVTAANSGIEWLDSIIIGYQSSLTWILIGTRALSGLASAAICAVVALPLLKAIRKLQGDPLQQRLFEKSFQQNLNGDAHKDQGGE